MRVKHNWERWQDDRAPDVRAALAKRYSYLPGNVEDALEEFSGRPGQFAAFARRRAMAPPADPGPVLATAALSRRLMPEYARIPRRYVPPERVPAPAEALDTVGTVVPIQPANESQLHTLTDLQDAAVEVLDNVGAIAPTRPSNEAQVRPATTPPGRPAAPRLRAVSSERLPPPAKLLHQVRAEVEVLQPWRAALGAVHRVSRPDTDSRLGTIRLSIADGHLCLFGRDGSRGHWANLPAETTGAAAVAVSREDVLMGQWGQAGLLTIFEEWLLFQPVRGEPCWAAVVPAAVPALPAVPAFASVELHRGDLRDGLFEVLGGRLSLPELPEEVRLYRHAEDLVLEAEGRGLVHIPPDSLQGDIEVRIAPKWLLDALSCAPADVVTLATGGRWEPLHVTSGWFRSLISTRSPEPYL
jgi:hypothetical protein